MQTILKYLFSLALILILGAPQSANAQSLTWAHQIGGSSSDFANTLAVDHQGASIIGGRFLDAVTFGEGTPYETALEAENIDGYIAKYRRGGQFQWAQQIIAEGLNGVDVEDIATDQRGNIYVAGEYTGEIILGAGQPGEVRLDDVADCEGFIAKYKHNGELLWAVSITGPAEIIPFSIAVDKAGHVVVSGLATGTFTFGEGDPNEQTFTNFGGFLASYDADSGALKWAEVITSGEFGDGSGEEVGTDELGNIYMTGYFSGEVIFGEGQPNETTLNHDNPGLAASNAFLAKYDDAGVFQWVKNIRGDQGEEGTALTVDRNGTVYLTGSFIEEIVFEKGTADEVKLDAGGIIDGFTAQFNRHGKVQWVKHFAGESFVFARDIALDRERAVSIVGRFTDSITLSPGTVDEQVFEAEAPFTNALFLITYDVHGALEDVRTISSNPTFESSIAYDAKGNQLMAGGFSGDFIIKEEGNVVASFTSDGFSDIFLMQFREGQSRRSQLSDGAFGTDALSHNALVASTDVPTTFQLQQNYPNPFNPTTTISYALPEAVSEVRLEVFDLLGNRVQMLVSGAREAGYHEAAWNGRDASGSPVASGTYLYRLTAGPVQFSKTMVLLK